MGDLAREREVQAVEAQKASETAYRDARATFTENLSYHMSGEENRLCGLLAATMVTIANLIILSTTLI